MDAVEKAVAAALAEAERRFGLEGTSRAAAPLAAHVRELLRWNRSINLTAIEAPEAVGELHLLDSLAIVPLVPEGARVVDVGTGAGFPGLPLAIVRPDVEVDLVDRTEKKVIFLRTVIARLGVANARARHVRLGGRPKQEGLQPYDLAVSRAFAAAPAWIELARNYVRPGGRILAMLGAEAPEEDALRAAIGTDRLAEDRAYSLPSGAHRRILVVDRVG